MISGKYCFGVEDTLRALEMGAVETLICWENLDIQRYVLKNHASGDQKILHLTAEQEKDKTHFTDKDTGVELELEDSMPFLEWLANHYKDFGSTLKIITDRSQEGSQFVRGFGGIGGMLRYKVDFQAMQFDDFDDDEFDLNDLTVLEQEPLYNKGTSVVQGIILLMAQRGGSGKMKPARLSTHLNTKPL